MKTKTILITLITMLAVTALVFQSCKKEDDNPTIPDVNEYTLCENVVVLDSLITPVPVIEGNKYTYTYNTTPPDFKVGDIIIGYTDGGYIKKISSIEKSTNNFIIVFYVVKAVFTEVYKTCNFDIDIPVFSNQKSLDDKVIFSGQAPGNVELDVTIQEGYINTDLTLNFKVVRLDGVTLLFELNSTGGVNFKTDINFEVNGHLNEYGYEKLILPPMTFPFLIGIVPAQFFLGFQAGFNIDISAAGLLNYSCYANGEIEAGAKYTNTDGWNSTWVTDGDFVNEGVNWGMNINANAEVYLKPEVKLLICGIAGPIINIKPFLNLEAEVDYPQWMWEVNGGFSGNLGFELNALGFFEIADYEIPLVQWDIQIDQDNGTIAGSPPTAIFTVSPSGGTTSTTFAFDASDSYDNEDPTSQLQVRWDFDGNGSWDTSWDYDKTENHQYGSEATYTAKMEVKDTEGLTDQYTKSITVNNGGGSGTFTDPRDGQSYNTIEIGSQTWFAENLNYETTNSWWYDNSSANGDVYGRLYTWDAALTACPSGWILPSDDEWKTLEMQLGMSQSQANATGWRGTDEGKKLKSTSGWYNNGNGTNSSGFSALPGGYRNHDGSFDDVEKYAYFWSSTELGAHAWDRILYYYDAEVYRYNDDQGYGFSVRCVKD